MFTQVFKNSVERWSTIGTVGKGISSNVRVELIVLVEITKFYSEKGLITDIINKMN